MVLIERIKKLNSVKDTPCITISMNTHKASSDKVQDKILLKGLLADARRRAVEVFGRKSTLLDKISSINPSVIDYNTLDSLHIFISNGVEDIIRVAYPTIENNIFISNSFYTSPLIEAYNRSDKYLILLISQNGTYCIYEALNNGIIRKITNDELLFSSHQQCRMSEERIYDIKSENSIAYDFYSRIDKVAIKLAQETGLRILLVCTNDNYTRLMRVARDANIYIGYSPVNHNNTEPDHIVEQAWKSLKLLQSQSRAKAIYEMKSAMSNNKVLTALPDIYQAALNGTGDLLIVCNEFKNPTSTNTSMVPSFLSIKSSNDNNIASNIAWEVLSKKGRVFFTERNELGEIGDIALKIR